MPTILELAAEYRYLRDEVRGPLVARHRDMLAKGASAEFADAYVARGMERGLGEAGWTRTMFNQFSALERMQKLQALAARHPEKVRTAIGDDLTDALLSKGSGGWESTVHMFRMADGRLLTVRGGDIPDLGVIAPLRDVGDATQPGTDHSSCPGT